MGVDQIYNPMVGINRMITDIEAFLEPILFELHPLLHLISNMNLQIVSVVLVALLIYVVFVKKHRIIKRFTESETYIIAIVMGVLFIILNPIPVRIGPAFKLNFSLMALPVIAKFLGPVISVLFGICQYFFQFLDMSGQSFSASAMLIGGVSGLLYAIMLYDKRTRYIRCLVAKLTVNIVCNMILAPLVTSDTMTVELAKNISDRLLENIFMAPFQALVIFIALKIMRKIQMRFFR